MCFITPSSSPLVCRADRLRGLHKNIFAFCRHILLKARRALSSRSSAFASSRGNKKDACLTQSPPPARPERSKICLRHASVIPRGQTPDLIPSRKGPGENGAFSLKSPAICTFRSLENRTHMTRQKTHILFVRCQICVR